LRVYKKIKPYSFICIGCIRSFNAKNTRKIWCSDSCRKKANRLEKKVKKILELKELGLSRLKHLKTV
jgi:hypothetical protein